MRLLTLLAVLCACALCACSSPGDDITAAANDLTRRLGTAAHGPLSGENAQTLRQDLQTLVAEQAGQHALVATGALQTAGAQAAGDLRTAARALGRGARVTVCSQVFGVDVRSARPSLPARGPGMSRLMTLAAQLRGGSQTPEAYLNALTDALCRA